MNLAEDLREVYNALRERLADPEVRGTEAANLAREIRIIGEKLEVIELPEEVSVIDELARKRRGADRPPARRRKSG